MFDGKKTSKSYIAHRISKQTFFCINVWASVLICSLLFGLNGLLGTDYYGENFGTKKNYVMLKDT